MEVGQTTAIERPDGRLRSTKRMPDSTVSFIINAKSRIPHSQLDAKYRETLGQGACALVEIENGIRTRPKWHQAAQ